MSTIIWPPLPAQQLVKEQSSCTERELEWLLSALQETLQSLKAGLEDCAALLAPRETGSTLVLSSQRSESIKGHVTLNGARIVKGDVQLRIPSLPTPRGQNSLRLAISNSATSPGLVVHQLVIAKTLINSSLDVIDATAWTGDATNADYISSQLRLLHENVQEAKQALQGGQDNSAAWHEDPPDKKAFEPALPSSLSFHFCIQDAALVFAVRTLEVVPESVSTGTSTPNSTFSQSFSGLGLRDRLAAALGASTVVRHDEMDEVFSYRGQHVRVKDKIKVETLDPSVMAALAKLSALEHTVALSQRALEVVIGHDGDGLD